MSSSKNPAVKDIEEYLEYTSGEYCTIVFDGYDEVPEEVKYNSFVSKLINRECLKLCNLVITSRPTASADLHGIVDRRVEILGFTKKDRAEYIQQSLEGNADEIKIMQDYQEANPFVNSLCYIPLNMTILICLLKSSQFGTELPKSQTEINNQFALATIARYMKREFDIKLEAKSLQGLPTREKQQLKNLALLAFVFLGKDRIVFSDEDVSTFCPKIQGKWHGLGLIKTVEYSDFLVASHQLSYNFLHFSMQEFLAAFYIASLNSSKQNEILQESFWNDRYLNASIMYCGLARGKMFALKHFLSGNKYIIISKIFGTKGIAQNTFSDKVKCLHLFQCFLEAHNDELAQQVGNILLDDKIDLSGHTLLQKDIHTLSFFFTRSTTK